MHSIAIVSILAAAATVTTAAPTSANTKLPRAWYVCANNGFRGECTVDPCALTWCPDYKPWTYEPITVATPPPSTTPGPATKPKVFYACGNNGFRGDCSVDPCALTWCPDYKPWTYEPVSLAKRDDSVCAPGTGYFQSCGNGFRGCCKSDACAGPSAYCPDVPVPPVALPPVTPPVTTAPVTKKEWYNCASNKFVGPCSVDACNYPWCPDYKYGTLTEVVVVKRDDTVCAPGTGYFQSCGNNGFRGCCKGDACGNKWCPDFKVGTFEPVSAVVAVVAEERGCGGF
jgi:hypothetical protein